MIVPAVLLTLMAAMPVSDNCGWCGADAAALGRALALGGPAPCYCPPPHQAAPRKATAGAQEPSPSPPAKPDQGLACRDDINMAGVYASLRDAGASEEKTVHDVLDMLRKGHAETDEVAHQIGLVQMIYETKGEDRDNKVLLRILQGCVPKAKL